MRVRVWPGRTEGAVTAPPSKSAAHRALIAAALAPGQSVITGAGSSADIRATIGALRTLGAEIREENGALTVFGADPRGWAGGEVFCGESGSTLRFLLPVFALSGAQTVFTGAGRLIERPQTVYADLFAEMGLPFSHRDGKITVKGPLKAGKYTLHGDVSSQFFTGLLFALALTDGDSRICILPPFESQSYLRLTQSAVRRAGIASDLQETQLFIPGRQHYAPTRLTVEGDYSGAAFFALLGALTGSVDCRGLSLPTGQGDAVMFEYLSRIGAAVSAPDGQNGYLVRQSVLSGGVLDLSDCPDLGPVLMAAGCFCKNGLRLTGTARLRYKESDRAAAMRQELARLGFLCEVGDNEIFLPGARTLCSRAEYEVSAHNDHRIAMALAVAAAALEAPVVIDGAQSVDKSYPGFWKDLNRVGIKTEELE